MTWDQQSRDVVGEWTRKWQKEIILFQEIENNAKATYEAKILLPHNPAIVLPGNYPTDLKTCPHKNLHIIPYSSLIHNHHN